MANIPLVIDDPHEIRFFISRPNTVLSLAIAAPYAPLPGLTVQDNINRAVWLSRLAMAFGLAPITPHLLWPVLTDDLDEKDPSTRDVSLRNSQAHAAAVGKAGGDMWVLTKPGKERKLSAGCVEEFNSFFTNATEKQAILIFDWETAGSITKAYGSRAENWFRPGMLEALDKLYRQWQQMPKGVAG